MALPDNNEEKPYPASSSAATVVVLNYCSTPCVNRSLFGGFVSPELPSRNVVYVVGAGLSAGLGFPTISNLLPHMWKRLKKAGLANDLAKIIGFHHPAFNPSLISTYPNIEQLLSEMQANEQLFAASRPATGLFTADALLSIRQGLLLELAAWFHELKEAAVKKKPQWLTDLVHQMKQENAQIISFNWDLVLDELLFGDDLTGACYGFGANGGRVRLIKPHGSLNWYEHQTGQHLKAESKFHLTGKGNSRVHAFRRYRAPASSRRIYMPLIIPPVYAKQFEGDAFRHLWQETVSVISTASEVRFLGYSMAPADFHARFILRCGFHNQVAGALNKDGDREPPTGRAVVTIVDPCEDGSVAKRITDLVGWECTVHTETIAQWMEL